MRAILWLVLLAVLSTAIQPAMAAKFSIYALDSGKPVNNAFIRVWDGNNLIDNGNTDSNGIFVTYLSDGITYNIKGQTFDKWDEIDYLADSAISTEIRLNLHA